MAAINDSFCPDFIIDIYIYIYIASHTCARPLSLSLCFVCHLLILFLFLFFVFCVRMRWSSGEARGEDTIMLNSATVEVKVRVCPFISNLSIVLISLIDFQFLFTINAIDSRTDPD